MADLDQFKFSLVTPIGKVADGDVLSVTMQGPLGEITILKDHVSLLTLLKSGNLKVRKKEGIENYYITNGIAEMRDNSLVVLVDSASCVV